MGRCRGFTLVEVLVALTIVSVALAASLRAAGSMINNSQALRLKQYATWSAENRLAELRVTRRFPDAGTTEFDCQQGNVPLLCVQEVKYTPNPYFRRVEMSVYADASRDRRLLTLITVLPNLQ